MPKKKRKKYLKGGKKRSKYGKHKNNKVSLANRTHKKKNSKNKYRIKTINPYEFGL